MSAPITPRRIEWQGPEGFSVVLDEDGVMLRAPKGGGLEEGDLDTLLDVIAEAKRARADGRSPIPMPPTPEQRRSYLGAYHANRARRAVVAALDAEFNPTDAPF